MTENEKQDYVRKHILEKAILSMETHGRYWNSCISRTLVGTLCDLLDKTGYSVFAWEIEPQWEHVFYLKKDVDQHEHIKKIAEVRYQVMSNEGYSQEDLPT